MSWDPRDIGRIVVSGIGQATSTEDGGQTWRPLPVPKGASVIEFSPNDPETFYAGVLDGTEAVVWISGDGGSTWTQL